MHILLIEPDEVLAKIYRQTLERARYRVTHVRTAQTAIAAADTDKPDLVVLELQLAAHSGSAFLYEFRSYADWLHIPVIIHTCVPPDTLKVYDRSLSELGIVAMLYKPQTSLLKLVETIGQYKSLVGA